MEGDKSKIICEALSRRIEELLPYGLGDIWTRAVGDERYHITTVLGIDSETWEILKPLSLLYQSNGKSKKKEIWEAKLGVTIMQHHFKPRDRDDERSGSLWFRFVGRNSIDSSRSSRNSLPLSEADTRRFDNVCPQDEKAEDALNDFYAQLGVKGKLNAMQFAEQPIMNIVRKEKEKIQKRAEEEARVQAENEKSSDEEIGNPEEINKQFVSQSRSEEKSQFVKKFQEAPTSWRNEVVNKWVADNTKPINNKWVVYKQYDIIFVLISACIQSSS